jgi:hypothetical protein
MARDADGSEPGPPTRDEPERTGRFPDPIDEAVNPE